MTGGVAVLDIGKTNIKVLAFDAAGAVVSERSRPNAPLPPDADQPWLRLDLEGVWTFLLDALREIRPVERVSISTHGAAGVLIDEDGRVAAMDYEWDGFDPAYDALRPTFAETLSPALPRGLNLGRQLFHLTRNARAPKAFLTYPQYWAWRLSGVMASEATSLGCHTDLWDPQMGDFSSLVARMGWRPLFPPVRRAWETLGALRPEIAAATGLSANTQVLTGAHDTNAAIAPYLAAQQEPFTLVSTGTWVVVMAVGGQGALDSNADMLANVDVRGDPLPCARFMGGREFAALAGENPPEPDAADVAALVAADVCALPAFSDQGGPFASRTGRVEGAVPQTPRARAALATLYSGLMTAYLIDRLEAPGEIVVEGGFARHGAFAAVLAALLPGRRVSVAASVSGAAEGAACLARWGEAAAPPRVAPAPIWTIPGLETYRARWRVSAEE